MARTHIDWTDEVWNPTTGCDPISPGCDFCYAEEMVRTRLQRMSPKYANGFEVTLHPNVLSYPTTLKKPKRIFVNSMSDLFHHKIPLAYIQQVFAVMHQCPHHTFQILTKRPKRLEALSPQLDWHSNIWMGVSVESELYTYRIDHLRRTGAAVKFLSLEPLLGPLSNLNLDGIDWVIVGGESGPKARPMDLDWARSIRDQCQKHGVPFFYKQEGMRHPSKKGPKTLDGVEHCEFPTTKTGALQDDLFSM